MILYDSFPTCLYDVTVMLISSVYLTGEHEASNNDTSKQSRSEKKSRKAMLKLGMKPVTDVSRVSIKRTKNVSRPDSFASYSIDKSKVSFQPKTMLG